MSKKTLRYFEIAKSVARLSDHRCKIGCVVVKNHRIISSGHNSATVCHGRQALADKLYFDCESKGPVHAEFDALSYLHFKGVDLAGAELYIYRETSSGELTLARPCPRCMKLIRECEIREVNYTGDGSYITEKF